MKPASRRQLEALAGLMEMEADFLEACLSCGAVADDDLVEAPAGPPPALRARLRRIQRLCRGLDLDVFAGSIVVDLLERIDEMERDLELLRALTQPREK